MRRPAGAVEPDALKETDWFGTGSAGETENAAVGFADPRQ